MNNVGPTELRDRRERVEELVRKHQAFKGTIEDVEHSESGLLTITMKDKDGRTWRLWGPYGSTVHLLDSVFGQVRVPGEEPDFTQAVGREVYYELDELEGHLVSLIPTDDPELG